MQIALYEPDIPQNTGTILRLCACLGVEAHIIEPAGFPTSDRAFRRAGMDYLDQVDDRAARELGGVRGLARRQPAAGSCCSRRTRRHLLSRPRLPGRRRAAVRPRIRRRAGSACTRPPMRGSSIPMRPGLRSLNVAMASAMAVGEALRQTGGFPATAAPEPDLSPRPEASTYGRRGKRRLAVAYAVKEIFLTLQGEGAQAGRAAVFCRFAGCNLWSGREADRAAAQCRFCDTDFVGTDGTRGGSYPSRRRARRRDRRPNGARAASIAIVVLTGGEPLLQVDDALLDALHARGFAIAVETNGTIEPPAGLDWICVSPKAGTELRIRSRPRAQAGLSAAGRAAGGIRRPRVRALLAAADGRAGARRQHRARHRLLPAPSAMAAEPADAQDPRNSLMWELTKSFRFEAAHAIDRHHARQPPARRSTAIRIAPRSRSAACREPDTGMIVDTGVLEQQPRGQCGAARSQVPQPHQRARHADAGEPGTLHLGPRAARRQRRARHRAPRQLRRVLQLFRAASVG